MKKPKQETVKVPSLTLKDWHTISTTKEAKTYLRSLGPKARATPKQIRVYLNARWKELSMEEKSHLSQEVREINKLYRKSGKIPSSYRSFKRAILERFEEKKARQAARQRKEKVAKTKVKTDKIKSDKVKTDKIKSDKVKTEKVVKEAVVPKTKTPPKKISESSGLDIQVKTFRLWNKADAEKLPAWVTDAIVLRMRVGARGAFDLPTSYVVPAEKVERAKRVFQTNLKKYSESLFGKELLHFSQFENDEIAQEFLNENKSDIMKGVENLASEQEEYLRINPEDEKSGRKKWLVIATINGVPYGGVFVFHHEAKNPKELYMQGIAKYFIPMVFDVKFSNLPEIKHLPKLNSLLLPKVLEIGKQLKQVERIHVQPVNKQGDILEKHYGFVKAERNPRPGAEEFGIRYGGPFSYYKSIDHV